MIQEYSYVFGFTLTAMVSETLNLIQGCKSRRFLIWLCGDVTPAYRSLAHFRTNHSQALEDAFCKMVVATEKE
jgi:hypothetical protein